MSPSPKAEPVHRDRGNPLLALRASVLTGPLLILVAIILVELLAWTVWSIPNPGVFLLPIVILATLIWGLRSGILAAILAVAYLISFYHIPGTVWLGQMPPKGWTAILAVTLFVPITELLRRRLAAEKAERFRIMADNVAILMWVADAKGQVSWVNRRWFDYTGSKAEESVAWEQMVREDHRARVVAHSRHCFEQGSLWEDVVPLRSSHGTYHWFLARAVPIRNRKGKLERWFGTFTDTRVHTETGEEDHTLKAVLAAPEAGEIPRGSAADAEERIRFAIELTSAEQRERDRLSRILHDDMQQLLVAARMQLQLACHPNCSPERFTTLRNLLLQAIETARTLSKELAPTILQKEGLGPALQWLAEVEHQRYGLEIEVITKVSGPDEEPWLRVFLFDVMRELLLNVVKHADTKQARIDYNRTETEIRLSLQDFGQGFDLIACRRKSGAAVGSGLFSLERRLSLVGGTITINTAPGHGTHVTVLVPRKITRVADQEASLCPPRNNPATESPVGDTRSQNV